MRQKRVSVSSFKTEAYETLQKNKQRTGACSRRPDSLRPVRLEALFAF